MEEMMAKVTIQTTDVNSPIVNTTIYEIADVPLNNKELNNLIGFLIEAKNGPFETKDKKPDKKEALEIVTDSKS
jgi:hypothetical protein